MHSGQLRGLGSGSLSPQCGQSGSSIRRGMGVAADSGSGTSHGFDLEGRGTSTDTSGEISEGVKGLRQFALFELVDALAREVFVKQGRAPALFLCHTGGDRFDRRSSARARALESTQVRLDGGPGVHDPSREDERQAGALGPGVGGIEDPGSGLDPVLGQGAIANAQPSVGVQVASVDGSRRVLRLQRHFDRSRRALWAVGQEGAHEHDRGAAGRIEGQAFDLFDRSSKEDLNAGDEAASAHRQTVDIAVARLAEEFDRADQGDVQPTAAQTFHEPGGRFVHQLDARLLGQSQIEGTTDDVGHATDAQDGLRHGRRSLRLEWTEAIEWAPQAVRSSHFPPPDFPDYALLDSGQGEKLERFGELVLRRPDPQALWRRRLGERAWQAAHLCFVRDPGSEGRGGEWVFGPTATPAVREASVEQRRWTIAFDSARFVLRPSAFKHVGLFPEQAANWRYVQRIATRLSDVTGGVPGGSKPRLLNLFGYTGAASVVAVQAGFQVTHVDASHLALDAAVENLKASGLSPKAMRLMREDALTFVRREVRRASRYELVLVDPPHYGRGPKGEKWQFEDHIAELLESMGALLSPRAAVVLSAYAFGSSPLALEGLLSELGEGSVESGELILKENPAAGNGPARRLPAGFCARWSRALEASEGEG